MQRSTGRKKNTMLRAAGVLFALVLITTWMTTGLLARYVTTASGTDDARVAAFVFHVKDKEKTIQLTLDGLTVPGAEKAYTFEVTNTRNGKTSEVAQEYSIAMTLNGSLPLSCELKRESDSSTQTIDALTASLPATTTPIIGTFAAAVESTHTYTLTVTWPDTESDPQYAYGVAVVELTFTSEQID